MFFLFLQQVMLFGTCRLERTGARQAFNICIKINRALDLYRMTEFYLQPQILMCYNPQKTLILSGEDLRSCRVRRA